jgi:uncharacterized protein YjdB
VLVVAIAVAASACSSSDVVSLATDGCDSEVLHTVTVSPASATLHPGDSIQVVAIADPCSAAAQVNTGAFFWKASDSSVATVDSVSGMVHARSTGTATIIATSSLIPAISGAMSLTVSP